MSAKAGSFTAAVACVQKARENLVHASYLMRASDELLALWHAADVATYNLRQRLRELDAEAEQ